MIRRYLLVLSAVCTTCVCSAQMSDSKTREPQAIIDVHMHAYPAWQPEGLDSTWIPLYLDMPSTDEELMKESIRQAKRFHFVKAVASGEYRDVAKWKNYEPDLIIPALALDRITADEAELKMADSLMRTGKIKVLGEMGTQYAGIAPSDSVYEPYFALAEKYDIPVAIHMGPGPVGGVKFCCPNYVSAAGNPLLLEPVLKRHPKLRINVMHAGWPMLDNMIAVLYSYPQVYVDLGVISWYIPRKEFHYYLERLVNAGFGKRILFGSDQMNWPGAIELAIDGIESARFLTAEQRRDIFYNNALRFLKLEQDPE